MGIEENQDRASHDKDSVFCVKPIIKELVRTQVCFPNIKLLVDKISTVKVSSATESSGLEAYCMYLTDGEKTIQAVVKRRLHKWLSTFDVREGSYIVLKEYNLARGKRLHGRGDVFYLAISDFYSIGEDQRYNSSIEPEIVSASIEGESSYSLDQAAARDGNEGNEVKIIMAEHSLLGEGPTKVHHDDDSSKESFSLNLNTTKPKKRKRGTPSPDLDPDLLSLASKADQVREIPSLETARGQGHDDSQLRSSNKNFSGVSTSNVPLQREECTQVRASPEQSPLPLQLSTLASITGANATRNKQVNILAMIDYVSSSTVKPATAPLKRDVRIVDPTTNKKVTLSIFIDPVNFIPKEYDIILFRNLTTHDFSGGNLNAYPKKCRGKEWYVINPYEIEGCDMKSMEIFRANYRNTKVEELE